MPSIRVMAVLAMDTAIPRDVSINNWHFDCDNDSTAITAALVAVGQFYQDVASIFSKHVDLSSSRFKAYNWSLPEPRPPLLDIPMGIAGPTGFGTLPHELACCLSFQGARVAGQVQARRRGRVYLGPLDDQLKTSEGNVSTFETDKIRDAAATFLVKSVEASTWQWVVHSTRNLANPDTPVTNGWVDDAFDVQRRRGTDPTMRHTFGA